MKKIHREFIAAIERAGARVLDVHFSKHLKIKVFYEGETFNYICGATPSDHRAFMNIATGLRAAANKIARQRAMRE